MGENTKIEWAHHTWNPWEGCQKAGPGCDLCYAEARNARFNGGVAVNWGPGAPRRRTSESNWKLPLKWNAQAEREGRRFRVFCASLADVFDNQAPDSWRMDLFALIAKTPHLDWLLLTKRIGNVAPYLQRDGLAFDLMGRNVWLGATVVTQSEADRDITRLLELPAAKRFLSIEPMLGQIDLRRIKLREGLTFDALSPEVGVTLSGHRLDWIICGGESGAGARQMQPDWVRGLRDQCDSAGVPFLFKQWGEWGPDWEGAETCGSCGRTKFDAINAKGECGNCGVEEWFPASRPLDRLRRVGKKVTGRVLDGRIHDGFPTA